MSRKKNEEPVVETNGATTVELPAADKPLASTVPVAEKKEPKGALPIVKFGPYMCPGERRAFLTVAVWKNDVVIEGGEVVSMYSVALTRTYYNGDNEPKNSSSIPSASIGLACLLLEKADRWIRDQRAA